MSALAPTEIQALARIIDDLDYYQLLHLTPSASAREIKDAYYATSRQFHPDLHRRLPDDLRRAVSVIARRISEAYSVLRDPRRRPAYDQHLETGGGARIQLAQSEAQPTARPETVQARTAQGRQYLALAEADLTRSDYASAVRNLQTAVTFEPGNQGLETLLTDTREKLRTS